MIIQQYMLGVMIGVTFAEGETRRECSTEKCRISGSKKLLLLTPKLKIPTSL